MIIDTLNNKANYKITKCTFYRLKFITQKDMKKNSIIVENLVNHLQSSVVQIGREDDSIQRAGAKPNGKFLV